MDYDPSATRINQENRIKLMLAVAREKLDTPIAPIRPLTAEELAGGAPPGGNHGAGTKWQPTFAGATIGRPQTVRQRKRPGASNARPCIADKNRLPTKKWGAFAFIASQSVSTCLKTYTGRDLRNGDYISI